MLRDRRVTYLEKGQGRTVLSSEQDWLSENEYQYGDVGGYEPWRISIAREAKFTL